MTVRLGERQQAVVVWRRISGRVGVRCAQLQCDSRAQTDSRLAESNNQSVEHRQRLPTELSGAVAIKERGEGLDFDWGFDRCHALREESSGGKDTSCVDRHVFGKYRRHKQAGTSRVAPACQRIQKRRLRRRR
jgi:hypothetical protein